MGYNAKNGYNTYREVGVKTASQGSLVVMLYEGAVSHLQEAVALVGEENKIEARNIERFGRHIQKVSDIITELEASLDMERGGEIAQNLLALYVYFNKELLKDALSHDKENLTSILNMLSQLRDSWVIAANSTANTEVKMPGDRPTISITG